jgi:hypothetical protein
MTNFTLAKNYYESKGGQFFEEKAMKFFNSQIESSLRNNRFFITSEKMSLDKDKKYTVRQFSEDYRVVLTVSKFQEFDTLKQAQNFITLRNQELKN